MNERGVAMLQMIPGAGRGDVRDEWVRSHGEAADRLRMQFVLANQIVECEAGEATTFSMQRSSAAVDVVIAVRTGGESELSQAKRKGGNQVEQRGARIGSIGHRSLKRL